MEHTCTNKTYTNGCLHAVSTNAGLREKFHTGHKEQTRNLEMPHPRSYVQGLVVHLDLSRVYLVLPCFLRQRLQQRLHTPFVPVEGGAVQIDALPARAPTAQHASDQLALESEWNLTGLC